MSKEHTNPIPAIPMTGEPQGCRSAAHGDTFHHATQSVSKEVRGDHQRGRSAADDHDISLGATRTQGIP